MNDQQKVREAFEPWLLDRHVVTNPVKYPGSGIYAVEWIDSMWEGWQAALAHASSASGEECSEVGDAKRLDALQSIVESGQRVEFAKSLVGNGVEIGVRFPSRAVVADNLREAIDQAIAGGREQP